MRVESLAEGVTLYNADCREVLPILGRVDAVVTDPPYGLGELWQGGSAASFSSWKMIDGGAGVPWDTTTDYVVQLPDFADHSIIWGGHYYALPPRRGWLIWDKTIREFQNTGHVEMAWTTLEQPTRAFNYATVKMVHHEGKVHPTQKPLPLMKWCLGFLPNARTVLDPFMGGGTTGVAAVQLGRKFIGIEIEEKYFDIACQRIAKALKQPDLFIERPKPARQEAML